MLTWLKRKWQQRKIAWQAPDCSPRGNWLVDPFNVFSPLYPLNPLYGGNRDDAPQPRESYPTDTAPASACGYECASQGCGCD